jgi:hypothetical protein
VFVDRGSDCKLSNETVVHYDHDFSSQKLFNVGDEQSLYITAVRVAVTATACV